MTIINFTPWSALFGGLCIGLSASLMLILHGRITGISGILSGMLTKQFSEFLWRCTFLIGLVLGSWLAYHQHLGPLKLTISPNVPLIIVAGLLVGFGSKLGGGCTSGHGICGLARLSSRSILATSIFMVVGFLVVYIMRHILG